MKINHLVNNKCTLFSILLGISPIPLLAEEFIDIGVPKLYQGRYECPNGESSTMPLRPDIWWRAIKSVPSRPKSSEIYGPFKIILNPELLIANTTVWIGKKKSFSENKNELYREVALNYKELSNNKSFVESQGIKKFTSNKIKIKTNFKGNELFDRFDAPFIVHGPPVIDYIFPLKNDEGQTFNLTYKGLHRRIKRGYYLTDTKGKEYKLKFLGRDEGQTFNSPYKSGKLYCIGIKNKPNYSKIGFKHREDLFLVTFNKYEEGYANGATNVIPILLEYHFIFDTIKFKGGNYQEPSF